VAHIVTTRLSKELTTKWIKRKNPRNKKRRDEEKSK
jgi:hypothetical protein